jgi:C1A family cysteine protease
MLLCFVGVSLLIIFGGRCVYRSLKENTHSIDALIDEYEREFLDFTKLYNKQYSTKQEYLERLLIFTKNFKRLERMKAVYNNTVFETNHLSDRSEDELRKMLISHDIELELPKDIPQFSVSLPPKTVERPASFDWRTRGVVMGIKNQGECGSCWAFSVTAVVESMNIIKGGKRMKLSDQELIDCDTRSRGCFGGIR